MKIERLSEGPRPFLNCLLYGKPGSGKTTAAFTAAMAEGEEFGLHDVGVANVEGGMLTVHDMELATDPLMLNVQHPNDIEELCHLVANKKEPFDGTNTVIMDSLTEVVAKDLEATTLRNLPKQSRGGKRRQGIDDIWLEDRGEVSARVARIGRWYRDLPVHFIATAHPREVYPAGEGDAPPKMDAPPIRIEPGFGPRLNQHLCGYFDFVWYMEPHPSGEFVRVVTQPRGPIFAKTRGSKNQELFGSYFDWPAGAPLLPDVLRALYTREWAYGDLTKEKGNDK